MSPTPRLLVVTPTLGRSRFLDRTRESVAGQPLEITHLLCAPAPKCAELEERYPGVRAVPDAGPQGGIYGALNAALAAAPGAWEWFTYINDDDTLLPGFGEVCLRHWREAEPAPVVYGDVDLIDEAGRGLARITVEPEASRIAALLQQGISPLMQQGMLFHRRVVDCLRAFDVRYRLCADLDFWLRAYVAGFKFRYYPQRVAQFRLRAGQLSGSTAVTQREQDEIVRRHLPVRASAAELRRARWGFRWHNLPRYLERIRTRGFKRSYALLETGAAKT
ncbi:MAG TPA: glycosyltransferase [Opitutaceae bacterium]|nr:glycosyltransferase [Opitutaceae bacterium]